MMTNTATLWEIVPERGKPLIMDTDTTWIYLQKQGFQVKAIRKVKETAKIENIFRTERGQLK